MLAYSRTLIDWFEMSGEAKSWSKFLIKIFPNS